MLALQVPGVPTGVAHLQRRLLHHHHHHEHQVDGDDVDDHAVDDHPRPAPARGEGPVLRLREPLLHRRAKLPGLQLQVSPGVRVKRFGPAFKKQRLFVIWLPEILYM